jgi:hypothetical protein
MPRKSTAPYLGPPAWLDVSAERPIAVEAFADKNAFCVATMRDLLSLGLTPAQSADVASNVAGETGWGRGWICGNGGGCELGQQGVDGGHAACGFLLQNEVGMAGVAQERRTLRTQLQHLADEGAGVVGIAARVAGQAGF